MEKAENPLSSNNPSIKPNETNPNTIKSTLTSTFNEVITDLLLPFQSTVSSTSSMNRILSRNCNGTIAITSHPTNDSELQLYRVLQRSNLLSYYDIFICQGGDDVQQLCEAGEEEFLEIMALVGMASKPLHVRRLQKTLQEWMSNPSLFQAPLVPTFSSIGSSSTSHSISTSSLSVPYIGGSITNKSPANLISHSPSLTLSNLSSSSLTNCINNRSQLTPSPNGTKEIPSSSSVTINNHLHNQPNINHNSLNSGGNVNTSCLTFSNDCNQPVSPIFLTPVLIESQINRLAEAAERLVKSLPSMDPKLAHNKKRISKELEYVMNLTDKDPTRMNEIRKYAAIYGRFDCKRKPEKPLTLHEVSVNEAAAQICKHVPALLTRRDELFPLARQVVRDSGYQYSKGHSRSQFYSRSLEDSIELISDSSSKHPSYSNSKRIRVGDFNIETKFKGNEDEKKRRQDRLENLVEQLKVLGNQQEELKVQLEQAQNVQNYSHINQVKTELKTISNQKIQLINEQSEINKQLQKLENCKYQTGLAHDLSNIFSRVYEKADTDETDSQFSTYSNISSPNNGQESVTDCSTQESPPVLISQKI